MYKKQAIGGDGFGPTDDRARAAADEIGRVRGRAGLRIGQDGSKAGGLRGGQVLGLHATVVLERAQGCHHHGHIRAQAGFAAFDVDELLSPQVGTCPLFTSDAADE